VAAPAGIPVADYMLGNELIFDHSEDFNVAMASPLRHELRAISASSRRSQAGTRIIPWSAAGSFPDAGGHATMRQSCVGSLKRP
jgi:hypothetical protein